MKRPRLFWPWNRRREEFQESRKRVLQLTELEERVLYSVAAAGGVHLSPDAGHAGHGHHSTHDLPHHASHELFPLPDTHVGHDAGAHHWASPLHAVIDLHPQALLD